MQGFKDNAGRDWLIKIDYAAAERVLARLDFKLFSIFEEDTAKKLSDPFLAVNVLWVLCEPQATGLAITAEQFKAGLDADVVEKAWTAIHEGIINFSQSRLRPALRKIMQKTEAFKAAALSNAMTELDKIHPENLLTKLLENPAGNAPESSESTPDLSRSES